MLRIHPYRHGRNAADAAEERRAMSDSGNDNYWRRLQGRRLDRRRVLAGGATVLTGGIALGLVGCGSSNNNSGNNNKAATQAATSGAPSATRAATAAAAASASASAAASTA